MKRYLLLLAGAAAALALLTQCTNDWGAEMKDLNDKLDKLEGRVNTLEQGYDALNAYSALLANLQNGKLIANVKDNGDGTFTITFTDNSTVTITAGKGDKGDKGEPGAPGAPGTPGNDGKDGDSMFSNVYADGDYLFFILKDGTSLIINMKNGVVFNENLEGKYFIYDGKQYPIVKLADGRWWMAAPMAYVPAGKTVSDDPVADAGIWYTYTITDKVGYPDTKNTDGYLYDYATAFGLDSWKDITYGTKTEWQTGNYRNFEGTQGICPPGWYIPTRPDFLKLVGVSNKDDSTGETAAVNDNTAVYYDSTIDGGGSTVVKFNEAGWNFSFMGCRSKTSTTQTGSYNAAAPIDETKCSIPEWIGKPGLNQIMCSTPYMPNAAGTNTQFFCVMTTFTAKYMTGRLSLSYGNYLHGMELRCIRKPDTAE